MPTMQHTLKELAEHALPCTQGDSDYGKDCLYWLLDKCKYTHRIMTKHDSYLDKRIPGKGKRMPVFHYSGHCAGHRSRKELGLGKAIGA